jgi:acyl carrier protein
MKYPLSHSEVETIVIAAVARALDRGPEEIQLEGSLQEDYGAESLDLLEVIFNIEKACRVRLPKMTLMQHAKERFGEETLVTRGRLTQFGAQVLRQIRPEINPLEFHSGLSLQDVGRLANPQTFVRLVVRLLEAKEEALSRLQTDGCPKCGSHEICDSPTTAEFVCSKCQSIVLAPSGDVIVASDMAAMAEKFQSASAASLSNAN